MSGTSTTMATPTQADEDRVRLLLAERRPAGLVEQRDADIVSTTTMARRMIDCGTFGAILLPISVPGTEPSTSGTTMLQSSPLRKMLEMAAASTSGTAWTRSVPTSFTADETGVEHQQRDHDDRAGADAGDADEQAAERADEQGGNGPDARVRVALGAAGADAAQVDVEAQGVGRGGEEQGEADEELERLVELLGVTREPRDEVGPEHGHRHRASDEPASEAQVGRALASVHDRAAGLVDRGGGEVGGDDRGRAAGADAEEDQRRRHQGSAAHAGQAYHDADDEAGDQDAGEVGGEDLAHPVILPAPVSAGTTTRSRASMRFADVSAASGPRP